MSHGTTPRRRLAAVAAVAVAALGLTAPALAAPSGAAKAAAPPDAITSSGTPVDLDALFIGAHPDDEAFSLSTLGEWKQNNDVRIGVITVTRGEGGGNAVGPEEGPALGLLREKEERSAVGMAGVTDVFNLDEVDFYYTVSDPLTQQIWDHEQTLGKVVRIIRSTKPEVLLTMNPAPSPGNHGNHQEAGRLAIEAFYAAADPTRFPEQLSQEHLRTWAPGKVLRGGLTGTSSVGPNCGSTFTTTDPSATAYGVWSGTTAPDGRSWAAVERDAQRMYASQGWAVFPDVPTDPNALGCDFFTLVASRVPFAAAGSARAANPAAVLDGALVRAPGTVPLGTRLTIDTSAYSVQPGQSFTATVKLNAPAAQGLGSPRTVLSAPAGWKVVRGAGDTAQKAAGARSATHWTFTVTPPASAAIGSRVRLAAHLTSSNGSGYTDAPVEVTAPVTGTPELLPRISDFEAWAGSTAQAPEFQGFVLPVLSMPSAGTRSVPVTVSNHGATPASGEVSLDLPDGFAADAATIAYADLAPGDSTTVTFAVTNTDGSLATSNQGGTTTPPNGDYYYTVITTSAGGEDTTTAALELVPTATIPEAAAAPEIDGVESPGEYPGEALDLSRRWEGTDCTSAADCSATAKVSWNDDTLNVIVHVTDDVLGTKLDAADCKRHWRVDSVELAFDPRGTSENTSSTFKTGILPVTAEGGPCFERDADNRQGGPETAPGMVVASTVTAPYTGYTVETSIPMSILPGAIDPEHFAMNLFVYDSDTQDKTGQTRLGWSTWGGVQGDPYRWGVATVEGYTPPPDRPTTSPDPVVPLSALSSLNSPPSLAQAVAINVPLAGDAASTPARSGWATSARGFSHGVQAIVQAKANGTAYVHVTDSTGMAGSRTVKVAAGLRTVWVPLTRPLDGPGTVLMGWKDGAGGTLASEVPVR